MGYNLKYLFKVSMFIVSVSERRQENPLTTVPTNSGTNVRPLQSILLTVIALASVKFMPIS